MEDTYKIELTTPELVYFGSALQLPGLNGIDDWQVEDEAGFEQLIRAAQESLEAKSYIRTPAEEGDDLALDQTVAMMVATLGSPQYSLTARTFRERAVAPQRAQFFGVRELIVEQAREEGDAWTLTALRTGNVAVERLLAFVGLKAQPAAHNESFHIAAADMAQLPYVVAGGGAQDGETFLREAGAPARAAARLAAAFDNPARQSMVWATVWRDGRSQEVGRLTLLEEVYGLWLIAPAGDDQVAITPVPAAAAADRLRDLAFRVLPPEPA